MSLPLPLNSSARAAEVRRIRNAAVDRAASAATERGMVVTRRDIAIPRGAPTGPEGRPLYGTLTVPADCLKGLAVHKALPRSRWKWMVTHEASGLRLDCLGAMTKARALENMRAATAMDFDWTRNEAETLAAMSTTPGVTAALRKIGESQ